MYANPLSETIAADIKNMDIERVMQQINFLIKLGSASCFAI